MKIFFESLLYGLRTGGLLKYKNPFLYEWEMHWDSLKFEKFYKIKFNHIELIWDKIIPPVIKNTIIAYREDLNYKSDYSIRVPEQLHTVDIKTTFYITPSTSRLWNFLDIHCTGRQFTVLKVATINNNASSKRIYN